MTYVRHRDRMVQESVFQDLMDTLIACRWMPGTTSHPVVSPWDRAAGFQIVTTTPDQVLALIGTDADGQPAPINVIDYFPESTGDDDEVPVVGDEERGHTQLNTLALDDGQAGDPTPLELGSRAVLQPYLFHLAFYANSDALAKALLNDLRDRYRGVLVSGDFVRLYDFNTDPTTPVVSMEVDGFQYTRDTESVSYTAEARLFYGRLAITDFVDD